MSFYFQLDFLLLVQGQLIERFIACKQGERLGPQKMEMNEENSSSNIFIPESIQPSYVCSKGAAS